MMRRGCGAPEGENGDGDGRGQGEGPGRVENTRVPASSASPEEAPYGDTTGIDRQLNENNQHDTVAAAS